MCRGLSPVGLTQNSWPPVKQTPLIWYAQLEKVRVGVKGSVATAIPTLSVDSVQLHSFSYDHVNQVAHLVPDQKKTKIRKKRISKGIP
jgi:hypothetical protein